MNFEQKVEKLANKWANEVKKLAEQLQKADPETWQTTLSVEEAIWEELGKHLLVR